MLLVIEAERTTRSLAALKNLAASEHVFLAENLTRCGTLLFRGFDLKILPEFENFARHFSGSDFFNYAGGDSPRRSLGEGVYTSTEYPSEPSLSLQTN